MCILSFNDGAWTAVLGCRIEDMFQFEGECTSVTTYNVGKQQYLVFLLPATQSLVVYTTTDNHKFQLVDTLLFPGVSRVISFSVAQLVYLAVNGEKSAVLRISDSGDFIVELSSEEFHPGKVHSYHGHVVA